MIIDSIFTLSRTYYYKEDFAKLIHTLGNSDYIYKGEDASTYDLFRLSRVSPRMSVYHFSSINDSKTAIEEAQKSTIVIFRLDIDKLNISKRIIDILLRENKGRKERFKLVTCLHEIQENLDALLKGDDGDQGLHNQVKKAINKDDSKEHKPRGLFSFKSKMSELKDILLKVESGSKANSNEETREALNVLLDFLENIAKEFRNIIFALNKVRDFLSSQNHVKDAMLLDKKMAPIEEAQKIIRLWKQINPVARRSDSYKFLNPYLIVGRDCVCNLVFPVNATIFNIRTEDFINYENKAQKQLNQEVATLATLYRTFTLNELFANERSLFFDSDVTSSRLVTSHTQNRNKIYEFDIFYHIYLKFIDVEEEAIDATYRISQSVAFQQSFTEYDLPKRSTNFSRFDPTINSSSDSIRSLSRNSGYEIYLNQRRLVVACRENDLLGKSQTPSKDKTHAYRYQAYKEYWQMVTSSIYSSLSIAANYLCGMVASRIFTDEKRHLLNIVRRRNFSVIASRVSVEYGEETMFKRSGGSEVFELLYDFHKVERNEMETRNSIVGAWENTNITISDHYNRISILIGFCSCLLAALSIGNLVDIVVNDKATSMAEFWTFLFKSNSFWSSLILFAASLFAGGLWLLFVFLYQRNHPLHHYLVNYYKPKIE